MTTDRPEVDDPRVLALAKARQQMAHENPLNVVCPPWDGLSEQEQHLSLLDARNYLRAALKAGLFASSAVSVVPPATNQTGLRTLVGRVLRPWMVGGDTADVDRRVGHATDAVMALWPAPADRAAVLGEAAARYEEILANADTGQDPRYWTAVRDITLGLRAMADGCPECGDTGACNGGPCPLSRAVEAEQAGGPSREATEPQPETVHACPPDGSGVTPCCGRTPFELPRTDRISSEAAAVTCAPAVVAQPGKETDTGARIVAHVLATHTDLHCLHCTPPPHGDVWTPVTADELDDGGVCVQCGVDVLIPQAPQ